MEYSFAHRRYSLPFRMPVRTAAGDWESREGLYIRAVRPDGSADDGDAFCRTLGDRVDGQVFARVPANLCSLRNALSCAMGNAAGPPRHRSLGVAALLPAGRAALVQAPQRAEAGFRVFKWKVGVGHADDEMAMLDDLIGGLPGGSRMSSLWSSRWRPAQGGPPTTSLACPPTIPSP